MEAKQAVFADLVNTAITQGNPIASLRTFLENESNNEKAKQIDKMRFVGYVLELGYDSAKIITSDPYKIAVGGIPRGSFLIMTPNNQGGLPPHFTLLRVTGVSPTPLSNQVQQTYFELHKKAMPELDVWTQSELQWGALDCDVLGMFFANPTNTQQLSFSGDVNNVVSAHRYKVFAPDEPLLKMIVNGTVKPVDQQVLGKLRTMECGLISNASMPDIPVHVSMSDFKGCRTAMFGKTRLGKSNVVKLIAQGMLAATTNDNSVGQLIFDINGEYANDNPQDGNRSLRSAYADRCDVYALVKRPSTPSEPLRLNFYEQPESGIQTLASFLEAANRASDYIKSFGSVALLNPDTIRSLPPNEQTRPVRKVQLYWAILHKAGFAADESRLKSLGLAGGHSRNFDPHFNDALRKAVHGSSVPPAPDSLDALLHEFEGIARLRRTDPDNTALKSGSKPMLESDDVALIEFLVRPGSQSGPKLLQSFRTYHDPHAGDFLSGILAKLDAGKTVILDLGNATDRLRRYFADMLSEAVFRHQEEKFVTNKLQKNYVELYFEEAHNLFPVNDKDLTGVYARMAKEGAKFHIGMVYSTQSPSTINRELLAQTENFFVGHLASQDETRSLSRVQIAFAGIEQDILRAKTPGYMRMLTLSHRFVIPMQANKFEAATSGESATKA